jgi:hypothetical protein
LRAVHLPLQLCNLTPQPFDNPQQVLTTGVTQGPLTVAAPFSLGTFPNTAPAPTTLAPHTTFAFTPLSLSRFTSFTTLAITAASCSPGRFATFDVSSLSVIAFTSCRPVAVALLAVGHRRALRR